MFKYIIKGWDVICVNYAYLNTHRIFIQNDPEIHVWFNYSGFYNRFT